MMQNLLPLLQYIEWGTLLLLAGLSILSIGVILERRRKFRESISVAHFATAEGLLKQGERAKLAAWSLQESGLVPGLFREILAAPEKAAAWEAAARSFLQLRREELERGLAILATLGSNAPFIGLFGTVLGIVKAFAALSTDQSGTQEVMSAVAIALLATAAGLFVAIPAVIAFNFYSARLRQAMARCESLKNLYLSRHV